MADIIQSVNYTTEDGKLTITFALAANMLTYMRQGPDGEVYQIDPAKLRDIMQADLDLIDQMGQQVCQETLVIDSATLATCDWQPGHAQPFHHDPRGFFWTFQ